MVDSLCKNISYEFVLISKTEIFARNFNLQNSFAMISASTLLYEWFDSLFTVNETARRFEFTNNGNLAPGWPFKYEMDAMQL